MLLHVREICLASLRLLMGFFDAAIFLDNYLASIEIF